MFLSMNYTPPTDKNKIKSFTKTDSDTKIPVNIYACARMPVCHHSLIPLWFVPPQPHLPHRKPKAHWSAWSHCSLLVGSIDLTSLAARLSPLSEINYSILQSA